MSTGLIALLDDVVGMAKLAAASLDDAASQAARASTKAAGIVVDDAAVTPRYVVGFSADRELPMIGRIALGSLRNKLLILLPAALVLSLLAPWIITPLLMLGGAYLCFEGAEKVVEAFRPHADEAHGSVAAAALAGQDAKRLEDEKVRGAIRTDLILSAEIMAITLATVAAASFWTQAFVLAAVGIGITALVYGVVALIVKADDAGLALAQNPKPVSGLLRRATPGSPPTSADRILGPITMSLGRGLVLAMPYLLKALSILGTAAMLWVGGGIIIHGLEHYGISEPGHTIHTVAETVSHTLPALAAVLAWLVTAAASGVFGLLLGAALIPVGHRITALASRQPKHADDRAAEPQGAKDAGVP